MIMGLPDHEPLDPAQWRQAWEEVAAAGLAAVRIITRPGAPRDPGPFTGVTPVPFAMLCLAGTIDLRTVAGDRFVLRPRDLCIWAPGTWVASWHADCPRYLRATIDHDHVFAAMKDHDRRRRGGRLVDLYGLSVPGMLDPATRGLLAGLGGRPWNPATARPAGELLLWAVHAHLAAPQDSGATAFLRLRAIAARDPAPRRTEAAAALGVVPETVSRLCRRHGGCTWLELAGQARLQRVEAQLRGSAPLHEIAERCGFASAGHLIRVFRRQHGCTPEVWRRANG